MQSSLIQANYVKQLCLTTVTRKGTELMADQEEELGTENNGELGAAPILVYKTQDLLSSLGYILREALTFRHVSFLLKTIYLVYIRFLSRLPLHFTST